MWAAKICPIWPISIMTNETMKRTKQNYIEKGWERTSSSARLSFLNIAAVAILKLQMKLSAPHQSPNFPKSRGTNPTTTVVSSNLPPLKDKPSECAAKANGVMMSCKRIQKASWSRQTSNEEGISTGKHAGVPIGNQKFDFFLSILKYSQIVCPLLW